MTIIKDHNNSKYDGMNEAITLCMLKVYLHLKTYIFNIHITIMMISTKTKNTIK